MSSSEIEDYSDLSSDNSYQKSFESEEDDCFSDISLNSQTTYSHKETEQDFTESEEEKPVNARKRKFFSKTNTNEEHKKKISIIIKISKKHKNTRK